MLRFFMGSFILASWALHMLQQKLNTGQFYIIHKFFLLKNCKENVHPYQLWQVLPSDSVTICLDQFYLFLVVLAAPQHYEPETVQFAEQVASIPVAGTPLWHCSSTTIISRTTGLQETSRTANRNAAMLVLLHCFVGSQQLIVSWEILCTKINGGQRLLWVLLMTRQTGLWSVDWRLSYQKRYSAD